MTFEAGDLAAFHAGDPTLFRSLVERHSPRLLALALRYTRDRDEAHDVVQDVWLTAYRRRRQLREAGSLPGWLFAICHNRCRSLLRRAAAAALVHPSDLPPPSAPPPADRQASATETVHALLDAFAELPPRQRDVVQLRLVEGRSTRETARLLGCAEGTVKATLHQALRNLQPRLRHLT